MAVPLGVVDDRMSNFDGYAVQDDASVTVYESNPESLTTRMSAVNSEKGRTSIVWPLEFSLEVNFLSAVESFQRLVSRRWSE